MTKGEIRAAMRRLRRAVSLTDRATASSQICAKLLAFHPSSPIAVYLASPDEIDLSPLITACIERDVRLAAPRWNGFMYELAEVNAIWPHALFDGPHGILEPPPTAPLVSPHDVSIWIVPGLAFTRNGARLGYGGGWYDRLMSGTPGRKVGVCYDFQVLPDLPSEPHDVRLDGVVTP